MRSVYAAISERSEYMSEQFSILIDSRTRFETGEPGGVWLSMPTTKEQLHEAMQRVGITADNPQNFFINGFANTEQQPFDVPLPVIQSAGLDELNYLGNLLAMQRDEDRDKFTAAVALGERAGSVKDLINLAQNLDCYWLYPTVCSFGSSLPLFCTFSPPLLNDIIAPRCEGFYCAQSDSLSGNEICSES